MADSWDVNSGDETILAVPITSTQTSGIKLAAMSINGDTLAWATQSGGMVWVAEDVDGTIKREWINFTGGTENADSTFTLSGVTRGVDRDAATRTTATGGQSFNKGATVRLVTHHLLFNNKADVDRTNTFTELQTFSFVDFTTDGDEYFRVPVLTEAQRDALTPANGMMVYVTDGSNANRIHTYEGGAWGVSSSSTVADASETVAGKVEIATGAEVLAETATGGTGATLVIPASSTAVLKQDRVQMAAATELTIATGAITVTQPDHTVDTESDAASDDLDTITAAFGEGEIIRLRAEDAARTVVVKDGTGNILLPNGDFSLDDGKKMIELYYDGTNWRPTGVPSDNLTATPDTELLNSITSDGSSVGGSSTALEILSSYTMPANTIVNAGDVIQIRAMVDGANSSGTVAFRITMGGTTVVSGTGHWDATDNYTASIDAMITVRTAGATGDVMGDMTVISYGDPGASAGLQSADFGTASSIDFTGSLDIDVNIQYSASNGSTAKAKNYNVIIHRNQ